MRVDASNFLHNQNTLLVYSYYPYLVNPFVDISQWQLWLKVRGRFLPDLISQSTIRSRRLLLIVRSRIFHPCSSMMKICDIVTNM